MERNSDVLRAIFSSAVRWTQHENSQTGLSKMIILSSFSNTCVIANMCDILFAAEHYRSKSVLVGAAHASALQELSSFEKERKSTISITKVVHRV